jgi:AmmeMemoRadiSam system protein B/AmmeMemoRadiSam system protein A
MQGEQCEVPHAILLVDFLCVRQYFRSAISLMRPAMWTSRTRPLYLLCPVLLFVSTASIAGDRNPAYADRFYPGSATELRATVAEFFSHTTRQDQKSTIQALIVPHAGYVYSGQVAASGFAQIDPRRTLKNVFVIGVSHNVAYEGAAVYAEGDFLTPLGRVPVNGDIGHALLDRHGVFLENNRAHAVEHSLEVQLPFLQYHLKKPFKIVPILLGTAELSVCRQLAQALRPYCTEENLFVVSTDLSHYPAYQDAVTTDRKTIDGVLSGSPEQLLRVVSANERSGINQLATSMCGLGGVLLVQELAASAGSTEFTLVQYKNSGDVPVGDRNGVVGYAAITVSRPQKEAFQVGPADRRQLLGIARSTIEQYLKCQHVPDMRGERLSTTLRTPCGAFVTLRKHGDLRGCIGNFSGIEELAKTVQNMAVAAATEDHRFSPVSSGELKDLEIEISVLTPMRRVSSAQEIELGKHGVYIKKGNRGGTFLPQVATETGWSLDEFLGHCARDKAGIGWNGWKDAELYVYEAIVFGEKDHASEH